MAQTVIFNLSSDPNRVHAIHQIIGMLGLGAAGFALFLSVSVLGENKGLLLILTVLAIVGIRAFLQKLKKRGQPKPTPLPVPDHQISSHGPDATLAWCANCQAHTYAGKQTVKRGDYGSTYQQEVCGHCQSHMLWNVRLGSANPPIAVVAVRPFQDRSCWPGSFAAGCTDPRMDSPLPPSWQCSYSPSWDLWRGLFIYTHGGLAGSNASWPNPPPPLLPPVRVRPMATHFENATALVMLMSENAARKRVGQLYEKYRDKDKVTRHGARENEFVMSTLLRGSCRESVTSNANRPSHSEVVCSHCDHIWFIARCLCFDRFGPNLRPGRIEVDEGQAGTEAG